jgi:hypothetical protein
MSAASSPMRAGTRTPTASRAGTAVQWHALGGGLNSTVFAIAVSGTNLYVGGFFTDAGGNVNADYIARSSLVGKVYLPLITR